MITIKEIAELAGVSRGTVDRVLNNRLGVKAETALRVQEIIEKYGYEPSIPGQMLAARKKKLKFGFIICDSPVDLFFQRVLKAAEKKVEELSAYGVRVTIYRIKDLTDSYIKEFLKRVEADDLDGIAMVPLDMPSVIAFVKKMEKKGIPLVFFNLDLDGVKRLSYVGCDYYMAGKVAAGLVALSIQEKGKIAIATSFHKETLSFQKRLDGFLDELDKCYPAIEVINRDSDYIFQYDDYSSVLKVIHDNPDITAMYIVNPGNYNLCEEIYRIRKEQPIKIITNDLIEEKVGLLEKGVVSAVIGQEPECQGTVPLQMLYDYLSLGVVPNERYLTNLSIHIKQNTCM